MSRLEARDLSKSYSGRKVIEAVSLHVDSGEVVGLLGPNGAGKTTCFYMIVGLIPASEGRITVDEHDVLVPQRRAHGQKAQGHPDAFVSWLVENYGLSTLRPPPHLSLPGSALWAPPRNRVTAPGRRCQAAASVAAVP